MSTDNQNVQFAETPIDKLRASAGKEVTLTDWAAYHDVFPWLLPFNMRKHNPIEAGQQINTELSELHEQTATVTLSTLNVGHLSDPLLSPLLRTHRIVLFRRSNRCNRYRNPRYDQYDEWITPITDTNERVEFFTQFIRVGTAELQWIAKHFDQTLDELHEFVDTHLGYNPAERRRQNTKRLGKTAITAIEWGGYSQADIARAAGIPASTLHGYIDRAADTEWNPPQHPDKTWLSIV